MAYAKKIDNLGGKKWYLIDRKSYRYPTCNSRKIGKAILGYPTEEDFYYEVLFIIGCTPYPSSVQCKFSFWESYRKFWKDNPKMRNHMEEIKEYLEQQHGITFPISQVLSRAHNYHN